MPVSDKRPAISGAVQDLIPGGILASDYLHKKTFDNTCSRCRKKIAEDDVPLILFHAKGEDLYAYCRDCNGFDDVDPENDSEDWS